MRVVIEASEKVPFRVAQEQGRITIAIPRDVIDVSLQQPERLTGGIVDVVQFVGGKDNVFTISLGRRFKELDKPPDWSYEMVFAALIGGLIGSRVDYLLQNWSKVSDDVLGNIVSGSGLVWFGGFVGGALGVVLWAWWRGFLGWQLFDVASVPR